MTKPPVALILFSNDLDNYLPNIETERKIIEEALEHYDDSNRLKVITRTSISIDELFRLFNRYSGRIVLLHFAGHADGQGLQFNQTIANTITGKAEGIAKLIKREVENGILKFVFLNGCSTLEQVKGLKDVGVSSIIATNYPINDSEAIQFAKQFYRTWAKSDDTVTAFDEPLTTIQQAFNTAIAYLKTLYTVRITDKTRGFVFNIVEFDTKLAWELFTEKPNLTLKFDIVEPNSQKKMTKEEILKLIRTNLPKALASIDEILGDENATFNDYKREFLNKPYNFSLDEFRSRLKLFVKWEM